MAVFSIHTWRPVAGRAADLLANMSRAGEIFTSMGGAPSIWQPISGAEAGTLTFSVAYPDQLAYGQTMAQLTTNAEWQAFWADALSDPSGVNVENYVLSDLDPSEGLPEEPSRVIYLNEYRTAPGRLADHLTAQAAARAHLERLGARVRSMRSIGRGASCITTLLGFDDFAAYGEFGAKFGVDEQWAGFWMELAADPPAEEVSSAVASLVELPA
ncbi:MAG: hypothetical protein ACLGI8_11770 [Acidimicrobiia bacterium]